MKRSIIPAAIERDSFGIPKPAEGGGPAVVNVAGESAAGRGTELAYYRKFTVATDVNVYFCDPKSPWQRGSNENTNGLRRYD